MFSVSSPGASTTTRRHGAASVASGGRGGGGAPDGGDAATIGGSMLGGGFGASAALDDAAVRTMLDYLRSTIRLKGYSAAKWTEDNEAVAVRFLTDKDVRKLVAYMSAEGELVLLTPSAFVPVAPKSFFYWVKADCDFLSPRRIKSCLQHGLVSGGGLEALLRVLGDVYLPTAQANTSWPEVVQRDLLNQMHKFMSSIVETSHQAKGTTVLYVPDDPVLEAALEAASGAEAAAAAAESAAAAAAAAGPASRPGTGLGRPGTSAVAPIIPVSNLSAAAAAAAAAAGLPHFDARAVASRRDVVQRLEATVIHWTRQVKEVIGSAGGVDAGGAGSEGGPLEEIAFWESRANDLSGISSQLANRRLKAIVYVLQVADSAYLGPFEALSRAITARMDEAACNLKTLSVLKDSCQALSVSGPKDIEALLPDILNRVRAIGAVSKYYYTEERIGGLLRRVSNEVIRRCIAAVSVTDVFDGDIPAVRATLLECIEACAAWRRCFDETVAAVAAAPGKRRLLWSFDPTTIFAQVDAYVQRCRDLVDVCDGQIQFARRSGPAGAALPLPVFAGSRGADIARSLTTLQQSFGSYLEALRQCSEDALDVKATRWHGAIAAFRNGIKELEVMMATIVAEAFQGVNSVVTAVDLLECFSTLARRPSVQRAVDKKTVDVYGLFLRELAAVKTTFESAGASPPLPPDAPHFGGAALWAKGLQGQVTRDWSALSKAHYLVPCKAATDAAEQYSKFMTACEDYIRGRFLEWAEALATIDAAGLLTRLGTPLLARSQTATPAVVEAPSSGVHGGGSSGAAAAGGAAAGGAAGGATLPPPPAPSPTGSYLRCNLDPLFLSLIAETEAWETFEGRFVVPFHVLDLVRTHGDSLRIVRQHVLQSCRDYNSIVAALDDVEIRLFGDLTRRLDRKIGPGLTPRVTWTTKGGIKEAFIKDVRKSCSEVWAVVQTFKDDRRTVLSAIESMRDTSLLHLERNFIHDEGVFRARQMVHWNGARAKLEALHASVVTTLAKMYHLFRVDPPSVQRAWIRFIQQLDHRVEASLRVTVKASLTELQRAICGDPNNKDYEVTPVFRVNTILDGSVIEHRPTTLDLTQTVNEASRELINVVGVVPRLEDVLPHEIPNYGATEEAIAAAVSKVTGSVPTARAAEGEAAAPAPASHSDQPSFFDTISNDIGVLSQLTDIMTGVASVTATINKKKGDFASYAHLWETDKVKFMARYAKANRPLLQFEADIVRFANTETEVRTDIDATENVSFVRLDHSLLKATLIEHCQLWQRMFTQLLNDNAKKELEELHALIAEASKALSTPPNDLATLARNMNLVKQMRADREAIEARFAPLEATYAMLARFEVPLEDAEATALADLRPSWATFQTVLTAGEEVIKKAKGTMKRETAEAMNALAVEVVDMRAAAKDALPYDSIGVSVAEAKERIATWRARVAALRAKEALLAPGVEVFEMASPDYTGLIDTENDLTLLEAVWGLVESWETDWESWKTGAFSGLDVAAMEEAGGRYRQRLVKLREAKTWGVWGSLETKVKDFVSTMPLIQALGNPAMRDRHWRSLMKEVGVVFDPTAPTFTLETVMVELGFGRFADFIQDLSASANKELAIETALTEIGRAWADLSIDLTEYKTVYFKVRSTEDLYMALEDHTVNVSSMRASPYYPAFAKELDYWEATLSTIAEAVELVLQVQRGWMYLESIFMASEDIRKMLPAEAALFDGVNAAYVGMMARIKEEPNAVKACLFPNFVADLEAMDAKLEQIQKALDAYLENKRQQFPRFYFLSNDDLLEILGQSRDPTQVQRHIKKCFEGIQTLQMIDPDTHGNRTVEAVGMNAPDGEKVPFERRVIVEGAVEGWLLEVENCMRLALAKQLSLTLPASKGKDKLKWIKDFPGQLLITAGMIQFTVACDRQLRSATPRKGLKIARKRQVLYLNTLADIVRQPLDKVTRKKVVALITMELHSRDVMERMIKADCKSVNDFEWLSQLRLEFNRGDGPYGGVLARQTKSTLEYSFEYQGNNGRLVITPLTDRCVLTLTTALYLQRGGAPAGPAGTGKTETVKDLGKNLAKFVVVFNCSDGLDYKSVGRLFAGLVQSGGWGCFDEFNRIEVEVLSVVAQQIMSIMEAIRARKTEFVFMDVRMKVNWQCGIFITMNPGYAGRSELPDNLKSLFRPVAMMQPDLNLIAEVMLQSEGFQTARVLAKKTVTLYSLMIQQLSKQSHYDYGLRSLRGVLVCAGALKRAEPNAPEDSLVLRAIRDMNLPKFIKADAELFRLLLGDLFPSLELPPFEGGDLGKTIESEMLKAGLQLHPIILQKGIELRDSKATRHCNMMVGNTLAGKSTTWRMLAAASTTLAAGKVEGYQRVRFEVINPKSVTMNELYGAYDLQTMEWADGVLSSVFRSFARDERSDEKWLVLDGPVDTLWIESMNTVMDDNKTLTLINGDRIGMTESMSLLFEVQDLSVASPATVSRAGMIYVDHVDLGWEPFVTSWIAKHFGPAPGSPAASLPPNPSAPAPAPPSPLERDTFTNLFAKWVPRLLRFKRKECKELVPVSDFAAIISLCNLLRAMYAIPEHGLGKAAADAAVAAGTPGAYAAYLEKWFVFACVWSLGAAVDEHGRRRFNDGVREVEPLFPPSGVVYDYFVDPLTKELRPWADKLQANWRPARGVPFSQIIVPTVDTLRQQSVLHALISHGSHVLIVGSTGTGKTVLVQQVLDEQLPTESWARLFLNFSSATSSATTQDIIEGVLEKKGKNKMGPSAGKKLVCFVDDLNMPRKDTFGSQPPLELLRQWADYGGWYDRAKQAWRFIADMQLVAAMGPPGGGRSVISERLQSRFHLINFTFPSDKVVRSIFEAILAPKLQEGGFGEDVRRLVPGVVQATVQVYEKAVEGFLPTPAKSHYLFNMRDIAKVVQGLMQAFPRDFDAKEPFLRLWVHEATRTFADRFTTRDDQARFRAILDEALHKNFDMYYKNVVEFCENQEAGPVYADFVPSAQAIGKAKGPGVGPVSPGASTNAASGDASLPYLEIHNLDGMRAVIEEEIVEYNATPGYLPLNLVFFRDALRHIARIARILRTPRGNALLVGVGGSGRQSLSRVAAWTTRDGDGNRMGVFQIEITKQYRLVEFHEDLKKLYNKTGVEGKPTMFLFSDTQIKEEAFLEDVNNILSSGQVPGLYTKDDKPAILDAMRAIAKKAGNPNASAEELWTMFIERVRANLHVVLAMSPVGDGFRNRTRQYPALVACTTIDWFHEWPLDALREVATKFLDDLRLSSEPLAAPPTPAPGAKPGSKAAPEVPVDPEAGIKGRIASVFAQVHQSVTDASGRMLLTQKRHNYVTPTHYLELVLGYRGLLEEKKKEVGSARDKLAGGLAKLEASKLQVMEMQIDLAAKQKTVEAATVECDALLVRVAQEKVIADEQRAQVEEASVRIAAEAEKCNAIAADAEADLAEAMPALERAMSEVEKLDNSSISEVKAYTKPPDAVERVMAAVMILMGVPTDWASAKKKIGEADFLRQVKSYDKDNVSPAALKKLKKYTERDDFDPEIVRKSSGAAAALATWALAIELYSAVAKEVEPKRQALRAAEALLAEKQAELNRAKEQLAAVVAKVEALNAQHTASVTQKVALQKEAAALMEKLERAEKLIGGLAGERERWEASISRYDASLSAVPGDALMAAAFLSYAGPFDTTFRDGLVTSWLARVRESEIPCTPDFRFAAFLADPSDVRDWNIQGLPSDTFSAENGVIVTRGRRWPLMVDPQAQANGWIKEKEKKRGLKVTDLKAKDFLRDLEQAITYGLPYLLQDVEEELDPALEPVLNRAIVKRGTRETIRLGDKELDYNRDFKLYITTKLPNPHYGPEVSTKTNVVNFAVREPGLEAQLLGVVVQMEEPRLEQQKSELVVQVATGKRKLVDLENLILKLLSEARGSLLDDRNLVDTLQASKATSEEVTAAVAIAEETEIRIDTARAGYRPVAIRAALLYFVLNDLSSVDPMYQFSLDAYTTLFRASIADSRAASAKARASAAAAAALSLEDDEDAETPEEAQARVVRERCSIINDWHTYEVYKYACRGLFERHKLLLSFQMCVRRIMREGVAGPDIVAAADPTPGAGGGGGGGGKGKGKGAKRSRSAAGGKRGGGGGDGGGGGGSGPAVKLNPSAYEFLLKGPVVMDRSLQRPNPCKAWLSAEGWDGVCELDRNVEVFRGLVSSFEQLGREWEAWYLSPTPEKEGSGIPGEWEAKLDELHKMALIRGVRPDRVLHSASRFVSLNLGAKYTVPPAFDLRSIYEGSTPTIPLVFVLSPGVDPTREILQLASSMGIGVEYCSLGQGQAPVATRMIKDGLKNGGWVFLQNCHLSISWMPALEKIIDGYVAAAALAAATAAAAAAKGGAAAAAAAVAALPEGAPHPNFRLWLASYPHPKFPISILQRGLKMTTEPPRGLRANLVRLYGLVDEEEFRARCELINAQGAAAAGPNGLPPTAMPPATKYARLLFCLCWFHAVLVERRKFKSLGWCIPYDFNNSDWSICNDLLADYLGSYPVAVPWQALRYLIAEANYGGRVTDDLDRRLSLVYVNQFFDQSVLDGHRTPLVTVSPAALAAAAAGEESDTPDWREVYFVPEDGSWTGGAPGGLALPPLSVFTDYVGGLPTVDPPDSFGQHPNADITSAILDSEDLLNTVLSLTPQGAFSTGEDEPAAPAAAAPTSSSSKDKEGKEAKGGSSALTGEEARVLGLAADLLRTLPDVFDLEAVVAAVAPRPADWHPDPLKTVLYQETDRYNALLVAVARSLQALQKGLLGQVVITAELEQVYAALRAGKVPAAWAFAYPSLKPLGTWFRDLQLRIAQLRAWADPNAEGAPISFWLPGFTYPTGFLTAVLQTHARKTGMAIDTLEFEYPVLSWASGPEVLTAAGMQPPKDGVFVHGLYLEGAQWQPASAASPLVQGSMGDDLQPDTPAYAAALAALKAGSPVSGYLCDPAPMQLYCPMPVLHFKPKEAGGAAGTSSGSGAGDEDGPALSPEAAAAAAAAAAASKKKAKKEAAAAGGGIPAGINGFYKCPLYLYPVRTGTRERPSFMGLVDLKSSPGVDPTVWVKRGTALLLALSN